MMTSGESAIGGRARQKLMIGSNIARSVGNHASSEAHRERECAADGDADQHPQDAEPDVDEQPLGLTQALPGRGEDVARRGDAPCR